MLPIAKGHPHTPQHLKSPYAERYICIELDERYTILIGPYLYPDDEEMIERMVRRGLYDIADIEQAGESREQLPRIPYRSAIAIGRLAACLLYTSCIKRRSHISALFLDLKGIGNIVQSDRGKRAAKYVSGANKTTSDSRF